MTKETHNLAHLYNGLDDEPAKEIKITRPDVIATLAFIGFLVALILAMGF